MSQRLDAARSTHRGNSEALEVDDPGQTIDVSAHWTSYNPTMCSATSSMAYTRSDIEGETLRSEFVSYREITSRTQITEVLAGNPIQ